MALPAPYRPECADAATQRRQQRTTPRSRSTQCIAAARSWMPASVRSRNVITPGTERRAMTARSARSLCGLLAIRPAPNRYSGTSGGKGSRTVRPRSVLHSWIYDDLAAGVPGLLIPQGLGGVAQAVTPVDDGRDPPGRHELGYGVQVRQVGLGDEGDEPLAHQW